MQFLGHIFQFFPYRGLFYFKCEFIINGKEEGEHYIIENNLSRYQNLNKSKWQLKIQGSFENDVTQSIRKGVCDNIHDLGEGIKYKSVTSFLDDLNNIKYNIIKAIFEPDTQIG